MKTKKTILMQAMCVFVLSSAHVWAVDITLDLSGEFDEMVTANVIDKNYKQEIAQAQTTHDVCAVEEKYLVIWQQQCTQIYNSLLTAMPSNEKEQMKVAENNWQQWYISELQLIRTMLASKEGTFWSIAYVSYDRQAVRERTIELLNYYYNLTGNFTLNAATN